MEERNLSCVCQLRGLEHVVVVDVAEGLGAAGLLARRAEAAEARRAAVKDLTRRREVLKVADVLLQLGLHAGIERLQPWVLDLPTRQRTHLRVVCRADEFAHQLLSRASEECKCAGESHRSRDGDIWYGGCCTFPMEPVAPTTKATRCIGGVAASTMNGNEWMTQRDER